MYHFFIDGVLLPVPPSKLNIKIKNKNETVTLVDGSEYNVLKRAGLSEISFECLLPNFDYPFSVYENGFLNADYFLDLFEKLKVEQRVFTFCVERGASARSFFNCALEDYTITESSDEGFDFRVGIKLKQHTPRKTVVINSAADSSGAKISETKREITTKAGNIAYKIKSGDTLWALAKRYYGDGSRWKEIYDANAENIEIAAKNHGRASSSEGWWIYPETEIEIKNGIK